MVARRHVHLIRCGGDGETAADATVGAGAGPGHDRSGGGHPEVGGACARVDRLVAGRRLRGRSPPLRARALRALARERRDPLATAGAACVPGAPRRRDARRRMRGNGRPGRYGCSGASSKGGAPGHCRGAYRVSCTSTLRIILSVRESPGCRMDRHAPHAPLALYNRPASYNQRAVTVNTGV